MDRLVTCHRPMSSAYDVDSHFDSGLYSPHLNDQDSDMYAYMNLSWHSRKHHTPSAMLQYHHHAPHQPLSIYIPPPHHSIHSPVPQHHTSSGQVQQQQQQQQLNLDVGEWSSSGVYPAVKQEEISTLYSTNGSYSSPLSTLLSHQGHHQQSTNHQTPQQQSPSHIFDLSAHGGATHYDYHNSHSPSFANAQPQQMHSRYVHPADVSPVESPLSPLEYPGPSQVPRPEHAPSDSTGSVQSLCDPRFVSGDLSAVAVGVGELDLDRGNDYAADYSESSLTPEPVLESAGAPTSAGTTPEDHNSPSTAEDDQEFEDEDEDYDDERDPEFTLGRTRRNNTSRRSLRSRSVNDSSRYNPYGYPSSPSYDDILGGSFPTRTRRTISNATASSTTSTSSASSSGPYPPEMLDLSDPQSPRKRNRNASSLPAPIPVPNLTKKSRGRRVPTIASLQYTGRVSGSDEFIDLPGSRRLATGKGARIHMCKVPGCGKCFARGEHLKRHVRSIHTYEKPHKCPYPGCGKDFSRHDNLGQHMRVHKDFVRP